jgi:hypothetical protein
MKTQSTQVNDAHRVGELFAAYDKANAPSRRKAFVAGLRRELNVPADVEEETFYPALSPGSWLR